ncbi:MAG TPA: hypothetical protein DEF30_05830 [Proteiniclasticum sp.]|uniref:glycosyltransferase family 2 protein n=1 Tax=Proteiniclasticum sp. TaxID=2053595 RepID=UPI000E80D0C5|nr:glycosyltransferase family 2 protein [Proteiniclasticum sp.]HBW13320.1 hypothetical protein [Proteiniclasticum sp.]
MENILISIIVPVYNTKKYLKKCVESIKAQTHKNLEIILVDDGSTDGSGNLCDALQKEDPRINVFHTENKGQAAARNLGIKASKGTYLGFVDSDDYIKEDMYEIMLKEAEKHQAEITQTGYILVNESGETIREVTQEFELLQDFNDKVEHYLLTKSIAASVCEKLFHHSLKNDLLMEEGYYYEDGMVILKLLKYAKRILLLPEASYFYVQSSTSTLRGPYKKKHIISNLYEPRYYSNFLQENAPELLYMANKLYCSRSMQGYRYLQNLPELTKSERNAFEKDFLKIFSENYEALRKSKGYEAVSRRHRLSMKLFSFSPALYVFVFNKLIKRYDL